jgi:rhodanese-related sulfurtransferase
MTSSISRDELKARIEAGASFTLIEALPPRYWRHAHLPGAINLLHDEVEARAAELLPDRDADLVVYCASETCRNSDLAAEALEAMGYTRVSVYRGGKKDWIDAGLPGEQAEEVAAAA